MNKKVCVIGLGYVGLPTAAILAMNLYDVIGVDLKDDVVSKVNKGESHFSEPYLQSYLKKAVTSKKFKAFTSIQAADIYIICVPTPLIDHSNSIKEPNLDFVNAAALSIIPFIKKNDVIILESTSPVGTTFNLEKLFRERNINTDDIHFAYCPERVLPGNAIEEIIHNDRIVGGLNPLSTKLISNFYKTFVKGKVVETEAKTAEMCKLAENSFRDVNIAFANELSMLCKQDNIDVGNVIEYANRHPRVNILQPSVGVGGHCIAIDPWFLVAKHPNTAKLIKSAREVNLKKTQWVIDEIISTAIKGPGSINKIACLGLTYKENIDDLRESPALSVVNGLKKRGYSITSVDPNIYKLDGLVLDDLENAIEHCDLVVMLVAHSEFLNINRHPKISNKIFLNFTGKAFQTTTSGSS